MNNNTNNNININTNTNIDINTTNNNTYNNIISKENLSGDQNLVPESVIVEFKGHRRSAFLNTNKLNIKKGDKVAVQVDSGVDLGTVTFAKPYGCEKIHNRTVKDITHCILRVATNDDLDKEFLNRYDEPDIVFKTNEFAQNYGVDMKVVDAEWQFDKQKLTIFFTASNRVDFRELVKELARQFKTRIELRQINSREETRRIGVGIGCCGQTICCTSFLFDFNQVTIEHAKMQHLSSNVTKLSGNCGRLKCCLLFEYENYAEEMKNYPPLNSIIKMEDGDATLIKINIFDHVATLYHHSQKKHITLDREEIAEYMRTGKVSAPATQEDDKLTQLLDEDIILE